MISVLYENEVIVRPKIIKATEWICPHCKEVIGEKAIYYDGENYYHRSCKNIIYLPSSDYNLDL